MTVKGVGEEERKDGDIAKTTSRAQGVNGNYVSSSFNLQLPFMLSTKYHVSEADPPLPLLLCNSTNRAMGPLPDQPNTFPSCGRRRRLSHEGYELELNVLL
jgi:hypothetical protein